VTLEFDRESDGPAPGFGVDGGESVEDDGHGDGGVEPYAERERHALGVGDSRIIGRQRGIRLKGFGMGRV
jgi:hypothetical protein